MVKQCMLTSVLLSLVSCVAINAYSYTEPTKYYASYWGTHTSINLYRCSPSIMRSQSEIERFIINLFNRLGLVRSGNTQFLYHYAGNGFSSGLSALQQGNGHTDIAIRMDELNNDIYIDFFSCLPYNSYEIAHRAQDFFVAFDMTFETVYR